MNLIASCMVNLFIYSMRIYWEPTTWQKQLARGSLDMNEICLVPALMELIIDQDGLNMPSAWLNFR